jgi:DDE superfamily endonuclease
MGLPDQPCARARRPLLASLAADAVPVPALLAPAFTPPTFQRAQLLAVAATLATGRRTVRNRLRLIGPLGGGAPSGYHRVLSRARWSGLRRAARLVRFLVSHFCPGGPTRLAGDDTVSEHRGKEVYGKARHRDPARPTKTPTAWRWGHQWVVLALLIDSPFATRPWALPVLVALYRCPADSRKRGRPPKAPAQPARLPLRLLLRRPPGRPFGFAAGQGFGGPEMARFAQQARGRLVLVSKFHPGADRYEPPPPYAGKGRPRVKGAKLPSPPQVVAEAGRARLNGAWYGGGRRDVEVVTGAGHWYKAGEGLVAVRWVCVHDRTGAHRDEHLSSTDASLTPQEVIERYTERWNIEATFAGMRAYLGLETARGWCDQTVLRAEPCLLGLYSVVALLYGQLPAEAQEGPGVEWQGKRGGPSPTPSRP